MWEGRGGELWGGAGESMCVPCAWAWVGRGGLSRLQHCLLLGLQVGDRAQIESRLRP